MIPDLAGEKVAATKDKAHLPVHTPPKSLTKIAGRLMSAVELELKGPKRMQ